MPIKRAMHKIPDDVDMHVIKERLEKIIVEGLNRAIELNEQDAHEIRETLHTRRDEAIANNMSILVRGERSFMNMLRTSSIDWYNIKPALVPVENDTELFMWQYARNVVSSMPANNMVGRQLRFYLVDEYSGRWLGITCLSSAMNVIAPRRAHVEWDVETKFKRLQYVGNISVCVPIQPFGSLIGGKLMMMTYAANELREYWERAYGDTMLAVETTSLYGKSSQYNRVKEFKYLGLTGGMGVAHIPAEIWSAINQYLQFHPELNKSGSAHRWRVLPALARKFNIDVKRMNYHNQRRGFYWCETASNSLELLRDAESDVSTAEFYDRPLKQIVAFWKHRWYYPRLEKRFSMTEEWDDERYTLRSNMSDELLSQFAEQMALEI